LCRSQEVTTNDPYKTYLTTTRVSQKKNLTTTCLKQTTCISLTCNLYYIILLLIEPPKFIVMLQSRRTLIGLHATATGPIGLPAALYASSSLSKIFSHSAHPSRASRHCAAIGSPQSALLLRPSPCVCPHPTPRRTSLPRLYDHLPACAPIHRRAAHSSSPHGHPPPSRPLCLAARSSTAACPSTAEPPTLPRRAAIHCRTAPLRLASTAIHCRTTLRARLPWPRCAPRHHHRSERHQMKIVACWDIVSRGWPKTPR
jgi:hypothetical protein